MVLNSFFAERLLSHGVASVVGYYRQVLLLYMLKKSFNLSIYMYCVGRCLSQVFDKPLVSCLYTTDHNTIMVTKGCVLYNYLGLCIHFSSGKVI